MARLQEREPPERPPLLPHVLRRSVGARFVYVSEARGPSASPFVVIGVPVARKVLFRGGFGSNKGAVCVCVCEKSTI